MLFLYFRVNLSESISTHQDIYLGPILKPVSFHEIFLHAACMIGLYEITKPITDFAINRSLLASVTANWCLWCISHAIKLQNNSLFMQNNKQLNVERRISIFLLLHWC